MRRYQAAAAEQRLEASRTELVDRIAHAIHSDGATEPLDGLRLRRASAPTELGHGTSYPSFCMIAQREIVYRLLMGEQGDRVRQIGSRGGDTNRRTKAIARLRHDFDRPLRIETMAHELGMSVSGFHHHFKAVTAMSPLQFQKQLRLQEARRLMLGENLDAASAGYRVGYDDVSQFNREYKRLFGAPPMRDVARLRGVPPEHAGL